MARSKKVPRAKEPAIFLTLQSIFFPVLKSSAILVRREIESTNIISRRTGENLPLKNRLNILLIATFLLSDFEDIDSRVLLKQAKLNEKHFRDSLFGLKDFEGINSLHQILVDIRVLS